MSLSVDEVLALDFDGLEDLADTRPEAIAAWSSVVWKRWLSRPGKRWQHLSPRTVALISSDTLNEFARLNKHASPLSGMHKAQIRAWLLGPGNNISDLSARAVQQICLALLSEFRISARIKSELGAPHEATPTLNKHDFVRAGYMGRSLVCALAAS